MKSVKSFLKVSPKSPHTNFALAYYLVVQLHHLIGELLEQSEEGRIIKRNILDGGYYRTHLNQTVREDGKHPFYKDQKVIDWKLIRSNITDLFQNKVEDGLQCTREYLREHVNKEWSMMIYK